MSMTMRAQRVTLTARGCLCLLSRIRFWLQPLRITATNPLCLQFGSFYLLHFLLSPFHFSCTQGATHTRDSAHPRQRAVSRSRELPHAAWLRTRFAESIRLRTPSSSKNTSSMPISPRVTHVPSHIYHCPAARRHLPIAVAIGCSPAPRPTRLPSAARRRS